MLKIYLLTAIAVLTGIFGLDAQVVTSSPAILQENSQNVTIFFHADKGNKGMMNLAASADVYAHTGVDVINANGGTSSWKYAPNWNTNLPKYKMEYVSPNVWKLDIGNIRTFYGVADNETVTRLCFVFRTGDRTKEGKDEGGKDIFINLEGWSEPSAPSTLTALPPLGATRNADGSVTFCMAAPQKQNAILFGSWNGFSYDRAQVMDYMDADYEGNKYRHFVINVPESKIKRGETYTYYYMIDGIAVCDPYARLVLDPWNDQYIPAGVFPDMPKYPADKVQNLSLAVFSDNLADYTWKTTNFTAPGKDDLVIYELLLRDFTGTEGKAGAEGTIRGAMAKIPYLKSLGINAVELLPIMEFSGNNSWGYNPNFYFAPDKAYGSPKDYKEFIDMCHAEGIAVILDIVFNQADGLHPWYQLYTPAENPFFNLECPHAFNAFNDWNQDYPLVDRQWKDALQYWLREYKVDGFRFDLVKGLGNNSSYSNNSEAVTNAYNASRVARMKKLHGYIKEINPLAYHINEDLATPKEENEMGADGELNWANVNYSGCQFAMGYMDDSNLNRFWAVDDQRTAGSTVSYLESHDEQRLAYKQNRWGATGIKGNSTASCQRLGAAAAQMLLVPGSHMIWQFSEFGDAQNTKKLDAQGNPTMENNTDPKLVNWSLLDEPNHKALFESYQQLIALRLNNKDLFPSTSGVDFAMNCNVSNWANGRTIIARTANKELYCAINPNITGSINISIPFRTKDNSAYEIYSQSHDCNASFDAVAGTITVPANCYAVICSKNVSDVEELPAETTENLSVIIGKGSLSINNATAPVFVYDLAGNKVASGHGDFTVSLPAGVYLVTNSATTRKVLVK